MKLSNIISNYSVINYYIDSTKIVKFNQLIIGQIYRYLGSNNSNIVKYVGVCHENQYAIFVPPDTEQDIIDQIIALYQDRQYISGISTNRVASRKRLCKLSQTGSKFGVYYEVSQKIIKYYI